MSFQFHWMDSKGGVEIRLWFGVYSLSIPLNGFVLRLNAGRALGGDAFQFHWMDSKEGCQQLLSTVLGALLSIPLNGFPRTGLWGGASSSRPPFNSIEWILQHNIYELRWMRDATFNSIEWILVELLARVREGLTWIANFQFHWMDSLTRCATKSVIASSKSFNSIEWIHRWVRSLYDALRKHFQFHWMDSIRSTSRCQRR